jgi:hypothetical protein
MSNIEESMTRKKGTDLELVVAAIEKGLDRSSTVRHDQNLPVLTSTQGRTRQCDIVIYSGSKRRPIVTIVEVQDRTSKVDIGTFSNWLSKLEEVGANQLVCVSRHKFPDSVIEKTKQNGSRVLLIEVASGIPEELPVDFIKFYYTYRNIKFLNDPIVEVSIPIKYQGQVDLNDLQPSFTEVKNAIFIKKDKKSQVSLYDLALDVLGSIHIEKNVIHHGSCCISFRQNKELICYLEHKGNLFQVLLTIQMKGYKYEKYDMPMDVAVYREGEQGDLGWFFEIEHDSIEGPMSVKIPIVKNEKTGDYTMLDVISDAPFQSRHDIVQVDSSES